MPQTKGPKQNRLLATLPADVQERLLPHMELIELPLGKSYMSPVILFVTSTFLPIL